MKFRESGMPEEGYWDTFFNPMTVLVDLGLEKNIGVVIDVGCGYGTFTMPTAQYIRGKVIGIDIDEEMISTCEKKAKRLGIANATFTTRDVFSEGFGVSPGSADIILLFNILHCEEPVKLLNKSFESLRKGGKVLVIHWIYDENTPRGPSIDIRPKPSDIIKLGEQVNFSLIKEVDIKPYHYGLVFMK